jgi:YggT family protein
MTALIILADTVLSLYIWVVVASVVLSWLVAFNVINTRNRFVFVIGDVLYKLTEPILGPMRRWIPSVSGLDLSPLLLIIALYFLRNLLVVDLANAIL